MGLVATVAASLVLWVVMWALGVKAFDGFWIVIGILVVAIVGRVLARHVPGREAG
jgi:mannose/fructose/N-acetylgalactosamine-specific phosphotransferase system component IID